VRAPRLVPRALILALAGGIAFDEDSATGIGRLDVGELDPGRLGDAGRVEESVLAARIEQDGGPLVLELEDRRAFRRRPVLKPAHDRVGTHADLFERRLDLVERQGPVGGERQARANEHGRRRSLRFTSQVGQAIEDGIDFA
jgi:hypothetical protein